MRWSHRKNEFRNVLKNQNSAIANIGRQCCFENFFLVFLVSTDSKMCEDSETTSPPPNQQAVKRRQLNPVCPDSESSDFEAIKRAKMMAVNSQEESELSATTTMQHHSEVVNDFRILWPWFKHSLWTWTLKDLRYFTDSDLCYKEFKLMSLML